jgi:hypothetical protein
LSVAAATQAIGFFKKANRLLQNASLALGQRRAVSGQYREPLMGIFLSHPLLRKLTFVVQKNPRNCFVRTVLNTKCHLGMD